MKRRRFLLSTLALAGVPKIAMGQSATRVFRIGWIVGSTAAGSALFLEALRAGLAEHGYVEGRNLVIEARYADDRPEQARPRAGAHPPACRFVGDPGSGDADHSQGDQLGPHRLRVQR
jgi:hypothetical protein